MFQYITTLGPAVPAVLHPSLHPHMLLTHVPVLMETVLGPTVLLEVHTQLQVEEHDALVRLLPLAVVPGGREGREEGKVRKSGKGSSGRYRP